MSAILSAEDLNDFISPGVACIKPIETLPDPTPQNEYEVTTEDKLAAQNPAPAQISLTDCLACSGCVTSAEAVLVSLQSHVEVLSTLDDFKSVSTPWEAGRGDGKLFVASVSPQVRASLAAVYGCSEREAGNMVAQFLSGPEGLARGGVHGSSFTWVLDTNQLRICALEMAAEEMVSVLEARSQVKKPILTSACPGWVCFAEKTHPHILPHMSRVKSPQALAGTLLKSVLAKRFGVSPERVWHLAIMPCFDKKLEASRSELTSAVWGGAEAVRDVDCVITARELISMAEARGLDFAKTPKAPMPRRERMRFPDAAIDRFIFPSPRRRRRLSIQRDAAAGSSGGYLWHVLQRMQARHPASRIKIERGKGNDKVDYSVVRHSEATGREEVLFRAARYYGFKNITNLVRRLKPKGPSKLLAAAAARGAGARKPGAPNGVGGLASAGVGDYDYVEVMACPGGCTNGGGQIRVGEVEKLRSGDEGMDERAGPAEQRAWLAKVDEAYFSAESEGVADDDDDESGDEGLHTNGHDYGGANRVPDGVGMDMDVDMDVDGVGEDVVDGVSAREIRELVLHWSVITEVERERLVLTSYREVESDVGKTKKSDVDRVAGLASSIGGGW